MIPTDVPPGVFGIVRNDMLGSWRSGILLGGALALLVGCGSEENGSGEGAAARILSFASSEETIDSGDSVTLSWRTEGAGSLSLSAAGILVDLGDAAVDAGEVAVRPSASTVYRLDAFGANGKAVSSLVSVEVRPKGPPTIERFTSTKEVVAARETFTLSWVTAGATSVRVTDGSRELELGPDADPAAGSLDVSLIRSSTFTLHAKGPGGESQMSLPIVVAERPTLTLTADRGVVDAGQPVNLSWTSTLAERIEIRAGGVLVDASTDAQGTAEAQVFTRTTFEASAIGPGGTVVASVTVEVRPLIVEFEARTQGEIRPGAEALVVWKTVGAEELILSDGSWQVALTEAEGSGSFPVGTGGTLRLLARNGGQVTEAKAQVRITEAPLIRRLVVGEAVTAGDGEVGFSTVEWTVDGASKILLEVQPGGRVDLTGKSPREDSITVPFVDVGTVRLVATNEGGTSEMVVESPVVRTPSLVSLRALPPRVGSGEAVELSWVTADAVQVELFRDGAPLQVDPALVNGAFSEILTADASYEIVLSNALDFTIRRSLDVLVGSPNNVAFDTSGGVRRVPTGSTLEFHWQNQGGTSLQITDETNGAVVCQTVDLEEILAGGCDVVTPQEQGAVTYRLSVANASGVDEREMVVQVVTGPIIVSFEVSHPEITSGDHLTFSWEVDNDAFGTTPRLTLLDQDGDLLRIVGFDPNQGTATFPITKVGTNTFTLTATTPGTPAASATAEVQVYGIPSVALFTAQSRYTEEEGDPVQVDWSTEHGATLEIHLLDPDGNPSDEAAYSTTDAATVAAGTASIVPTVAQPGARLVVRNPLGVEASSDLWIDVNPATVISFEGSASDVASGNDLTLTWSTTRATKVELLHVERDGVDFIDLSTRPSSDIAAVTGDSTMDTVPFPDGFRFPYDGQTHAQVRVSPDGWLAFDPAASSAAGNAAFPSTSLSRVRIAPFWDDLHTSRMTPPSADGEGVVYTELITEPSGRRYFVVQWSHFHPYDKNSHPADLNFEVILHENGDFEYRYGTMTAATDVGQGSAATIGYQNSTGTVGKTLSHNSAWPDGLTGKGFYFFAPGAFPATRPESGTLATRPLPGTYTFTLEATNGHSSDRATVDVVVHPAGHLRAWTVPAEPMPGEDVTLHWEGANLTALAIEDAGGAVIHTAAPAELQGGSLSVGGLSAGDHTYHFHGVGLFPGDAVEVESTVPVYDAFDLHSFAASSPRIKLGESFDLSWAATNAQTITIEQLPGGQLQHPALANPNQGSISLSPQETTTYLLTLESHGRVRTAEVRVEVRRVWIDEATFSTGSTLPGGGLEVTWSTTGEGTVTIEPESAFHVLQEVVGKPFVSIASVGTELTNANTSTDTGRYPVTFPAGFSFPFFGQEMTAGQMMADGYFTFNTSESSSFSAKPQMPTGNTSTALRAFGLFWADLDAKTTGRAYSHYVQDPVDPEDDHMIFEWANWQFYSSTNNGPNPDLNFQLVLYRSGAFEFRYGTMVAADENRASGSVTGTGWQDPSATKGYQLSYNSAVPGGLANRTWRWEEFTPDAEGSYTFRPPETDRYRVCIEESAWKECEERIVTVLEPGDLLITEIMVDPATSAGQWVEIRNLTASAIDLQGMELVMGEESHTITGSLVVPPGAYAVLGQDADPEVAPDYVYGAEMEMALPAGDVSLVAGGTKLAEARWTSSWTFTPGASLELKPQLHHRGKAVRDTFADYCVATAAYGGGSGLGTPGSHADACGSVNGYLLDFASPMPFIDISATGTEIASVNVDTAAAMVGRNLGFTMPFFGDEVSQVWVNSNGLVGFTGTPDTSAANRALGAGTAVRGVGLVAAFWDDLTRADDGSSSFKWEQRTVMGSRLMILQWTGYKRYGQAGSVTFQVQLWENGDIAVVYDRIHGVHAYYKGSDATVGIEGIGATGPFLTYSHNQAYLRSFQSLLFQKL